MSPLIPPASGSTADDNESISACRKRKQRAPRVGWKLSSAAPARTVSLSQRHTGSLGPVAIKEASFLRSTHQQAVGNGRDKRTDRDDFRRGNDSVGYSSVVIRWTQNFARPSRKTQRSPREVSTPSPPTPDDGIPGFLPARRLASLAIQTARQPDRAESQMPR